MMAYTEQYAIALHIVSDLSCTKRQWHSRINHRWVALRLKTGMLINCDNATKEMFPSPLVHCSDDKQACAGVLSLPFTRSVLCTPH